MKVLTAEKQQNRPGEVTQRHVFLLITYSKKGTETDKPIQFFFHKLLFFLGINIENGP